MRGRMAVPDDEHHSQPCPFEHALKRTLDASIGPDPRVARTVLGAISDRSPRQIAQVHFYSMLRRMCVAAAVLLCVLVGLAGALALRSPGSEEPVVAAPVETVTPTPLEEETYLQEYIYGVENFSAYLEGCGGKKKLAYLKRREALEEPKRAPWRER